jgi:tRNA(adenine34) deaminase
MDRMDRDTLFMQKALREALKAYNKNEVPVGAVVVKEGEIIARGFNNRENSNDPLGHAEIIAIKRAAKRLGRWRLNDCTLYVTLEPCLMCAGAIINARLKRLVYGCPDPKAGAIESLYHIAEDKRLNHRVEVTRGILAAECSEILKGFFAQRRNSQCPKP